MRPVVLQRAIAIMCRAAETKILDFLVPPKPDETKTCESVHWPYRILYINNSVYMYLFRRRYQAYITNRTSPRLHLPT